MEIFKGPLGSHINYLTHIALPNCLDYLNLINPQKEQNKNPEKYKRLRYFLNAIESTNNIPEYFFHEYKKSQGWADTQLQDILGKIRSKHLILRDIEQISNAYKHCVRRKENEIHAKDMQSSFIQFEVSPEGIKVEYLFESIEDEKIMGEAFRFWTKYHQKQDISILLP